MCVGLPGRIVEIIDAVHGLVRAKVGDRIHQVSVAILDDEDLQVGDWVEIHMGHALARLSDEEAREALEFMDELDAAHRASLDDAGVDDGEAG